MQRRIVIVSMVIVRVKRRRNIRDKMIACYWIVHASIWGRCCWAMAAIIIYHKATTNNPSS